MHVELYFPWKPCAPLLWLLLKPPLPLGPPLPLPFPLAKPFPLPPFCPVWSLLLDFLLILSFNCWSSFLNCLISDVEASAAACLTPA